MIVAAAATTTSFAANATAFVNLAGTTLVWWMFYD